MVDIEFPFVGGYNKDYDPIINAEDTVNYYVSKTVATDESNKEINALIPFPGSLNVLTFSTLPPTSEVRNMFVLDENESFMAVVSSHVFVINSQLVPNDVGEIDSGSGFVSIQDNQEGQVLLVDGGKGYIYNGSSVSPIVDDDFPTDPICAAYLDDYFIVAQGSTNRFFPSKQSDGTDWSGLFGSLTSQTEKLRGIAVIRRRIFVMGQSTTEVWYSRDTLPGTLSDTFPFLRDNNLAIAIGCITPGSIANNNDVCVWLGKTVSGGPIFVMTKGGDVTPISTPSITIALQQYEDLTDFRSYLYEINGYLFCDFSSTINNITFTYNFTTSSWTRKSMLNDGRYFGQCHVYFQTKHYVGYYNLNKIAEINRIYTNNSGEPIKKVRVSQNFIKLNGTRFEAGMFEIIFLQGSFPSANSNYLDRFYYITPEGLIYINEEGIPYVTPEFVEASESQLTAFNGAPVVYLPVSGDGGHTFPFEITQPLGKIGQYEWQTIWNNLGVYRQMIVKMVCYDDVELVILGANFCYQQLPR